MNRASMPQSRVRLVSTTRLSEAEFWQSSLLGQSLRAMPEGLRPELALRFDNVGIRQLGLSTFYNRALDSCPNEVALLFAHDDVYLHDAFICDRVLEGLDNADIIGLAGSRGSDLRQPSWCLAFDSDLNGLGWQCGPGIALGGAVNHALGGAVHPALGGAGSPAHQGPPRLQSNFSYGPSASVCDLLDGLFLALRPGVLKANHVRFDPQFRFHLYDLDLCRSAQAAGLRLMTWPILCTHGSGGSFSSPAWKLAARAYLDKWAAIARDAPRPALERPSSADPYLSPLGALPPP